ncbi:17-beta-hydroxysteroid dehydrogenase 13 isoform X1 [Anastrepha obliqua]|uniref:17-beta-hydroxysteroid dehydrogenase 13 isoform X1 n=1 Tax=Anastrepha obliqua TaxID=95512 RepID=UPI00240A447A|nr:17-beta-hydroxysteroid dehydrogenase 13 isoform X1 [Anastrepha obliqua]
MSNETFKVGRACLVLGVALFFTPIGLLIAVSIYFYNTFVARKACKNIAGEVAVVTGSAGGLGKSIAAELASKGCNVAICDINYKLAEVTAKEIADKYGVKANAYKVDVTKYEEVVDLKEKLTREIGPATILVNNAGLLIHSDQLNPTVEEIELMVKVNYMSHFWTNRVFLEDMKKANKGHIVAICSVAGLVTLPYSEPYCSSKNAVRALMRVLRAELKLEGLNIDATTVFPSFLQTHARVKQFATDSGFSDLYPLLEGEDVAKRIVQGMLQREVEVAVPGFFMLTYRLISLLPARAQDWVTYMPMMRLNTFQRAFASIKEQ